MISVIMAAYNGAKYIEEMLDSIAAQDQPADEILVRDDVSKDETVRVVEEWIQKHPDVPVRLIQGKENKGYIGNFRELMKEAKGEWIFLCDQDDRWHQDKIRTMMNEVKKNPQIRVLASSFAYMNSDSQIYQVPVRKGWSNQNLIPWQVENPGGLNNIDVSMLYLHNYFQGCAMLVHSSLIGRYLDVYTEKMPHDWLLALLGAFQNGLVYLDQALFDYRIHDKNTTGLPQAKKRNKIDTIKTWMNHYYRTVVISDMLNVLDTVEESFPEYWNEDLKNRKDFCIHYLQAINTRNFKDFVRLNHHPGKQACVTGKEFFVTGVYTFLSRWIEFPDHK